VLHSAGSWSEPLDRAAFGSPWMVAFSLHTVVPDGNTETYVWYVDSVALIPSGQP